MSEIRVLSLSPFVPSGKDYAASRRLFADLGFQEEWEHDGYAGFRNGDARFILQKFHDDAFAQPAWTCRPRERGLSAARSRSSPLPRAA